MFISFVIVPCRSIWLEDDYIFQNWFSTCKTIHKRKKQEPPPIQSFNLSVCLHPDFTIASLLVPLPYFLWTFRRWTFRACYTFQWIMGLGKFFSFKLTPFFYLSLFFLIQSKQIRKASPYRKYHNLFIEQIMYLSTIIRSVSLAYEVWRRLINNSWLKGLIKSGGR